MSKLTKIFGVCGSAILIIFDIWALIGCFSLSSVELFNGIINNMLPCGLILGALALCVIFNKSAKKPLTIITLVLFGITALIRTIIVVLYILELALATYLQPLTIVEYLDFAEFLAYAILSVSVIFLMIYVLKGKMQKATLVLGGISIIALIVAWIVRIYQYISFGITAESGAVAILGEIFTAGLIWDILIITGYTLVIATLTGTMDKKEKQV